MSRPPTLVSCALAIPLIVAIGACERRVEPPPMVPEGTAKATSSGAQPDIKPPAELPPATDQTSKPNEPAPKDTKPKEDSK